MPAGPNDERGADLTDAQAAEIMGTPTQVVNSATLIAARGGHVVGRVLVEVRPGAAALLAFHDVASLAAVSAPTTTRFQVLIDATGGVSINIGVEFQRGIVVVPAANMTVWVVWK